MFDVIVVSIDITVESTPKTRKTINPFSRFPQGGKLRAL